MDSETKFEMDQEEDKHLSNKLFGKLAELLEKLPPATLNRNDLCLCGSGKKYKKCCLGKERNSSSPEMHLESFQITKDALTSEESQNNFPVLSEKDEELMATLYHNLHEHPETIDSENCDYFRQLNMLRIKNPGNPVILNYIGNGYQLLGMQDKLDELIAETYEKFPDYLFAQIAQANLYLSHGLAEKALGVLQGAYTLKKLYPHRNVFHISEVRAFEHFMVGYFCMTENMEQAKFHLQLMEKVLQEDDPLLQSAQNIARKAKGIYKLKAGMSRFLKLAGKK